MYQSFETFLVTLHDQVLEHKNGTPLSQVESDFSRWAKHMSKRYESGALSYGDESYRRPPAALAREIEEEAVDIPVWGAILHTQQFPADLKARLVTICARSFWLWREIDSVRRELASLKCHVRLPSSTQPSA